jgi:hypothetical protein
VDWHKEGMMGTRQGRVYGKVDSAVSGYFIDCDGKLWQVDRGWTLYPCWSCTIESKGAWEAIGLEKENGEVLDTYAFYRSMEDVYRALGLVWVQ